MSIEPALFSSDRSDWETPPDFFERYRRRFELDLDVCATDFNAKLPEYFTEADNGLEQDWAPHRCWMNPPYGRDIKRWVAKALEESRKGALVVALLPARTDTQWWHDCVWGYADVEFIRGRLKFVGAQHGAPFPSAIAIYYPYATLPLHTVLESSTKEP